MYESRNRASVRPYIPKRLRGPSPKESESKSVLSRESVSALEPRFPDSTGNVCGNHKNDGVSSAVPCNLKHVLQVHTKPISCLRLHSKLSHLAFTASLDGKVVILDIAQGKISSYLKGHSEGVKCIRLNLAGTNVLSGGFDKLACIHDVGTGQRVFQLELDDYLTSCVYHPVQEHVFIAGMFTRGIVAVDLRSSQMIRKYKVQTGQIHDLLFLPDNKLFLSAAEVERRQCVDKAIISWDFESGAVMPNQIYQDPYPCTALRLHPGGSEFLAQSAAGYIAIFNTKSPYKLNKYKRFEGHQTAGYVTGFSISPDGNLISSGDNDGSIYIYNYSSAKLVKRLIWENHAAITDVSFHPSLAKGFCASTWDGKVAIWE